MDTVTFISVLVAIIGCTVGIAGYSSSRDKRISEDAQWKGSVNAKLDNIHADIGGVSKDISEIKSEQAESNKHIEALDKRTTTIEAIIGLRKESGQAQENIL